MVKEQPTQTNWDKRKEDKKIYFKNELYNFSLELHLKFNEIFPKEQTCLLLFFSNISSLLLFLIDLKRQAVVWQFFDLDCTTCVKFNRIS